MVSFLLKTEWRRWYVVRAYGPPNDTPNIAHMDQVLDNAVKGV